MTETQIDAYTTNHIPMCCPRAPDHHGTIGTPKHALQRELCACKPYGTGLGERLALGVLGVLGGGRAVGDEHDVALAPDELLDLLALVALGDLRVGRRPPVSPAELERRAHQRVVARRWLLGLVVSNAVDLARRLELRTPLVSEVRSRVVRPKKRYVLGSCRVGGASITMLGSAQLNQQPPRRRGVG